MSTRSIGEQFETATCEYLNSQGLKLIEKNFYSRFGEIDLIMKDNDAYVFVEVRLRNHPGYATGLESVTPHKQNKIRKTAMLYLQKARLMDKVPCRFDVVAVNQQHENTTFEWIKNAF